MSAQREDRGNLLKFTATFWSTLMPQAIPAAAELKLSFKTADGDRVQSSYPMVRDEESGDWVYIWDSSEAADGRVFYVAQSSGPLVASKQGSFILAANLANA